MSTSIAVVFPGQGSQSVGMLKEFYNTFPSVRMCFEEASEILNYSLWELIENGPEEKLNQTEKTQPALLVSGYAIWKILQSEFGLKPSFLAGHSLGEYTALLVSEVFSFSTAVQLVACRGRYMQEAVPLGEGAMAAIIGLEDHQVETLCRVVSDEIAYVAPANYNAIGQIVVAGKKLGVEKVIELALQSQAKLAKEIPVSAPSHCELMRSATIKLEEKLAHVAFNDPIIPIIQNVDAKVHIEKAKIKDCLVQQLANPVRWVETIQFMKMKGVQSIIEIGPGKVLNGLMKRIDRTLSLFSANDLNDLERIKTGLNT